MSVLETKKKPKTKKKAVKQPAPKLTDEQREQIKNDYKTNRFTLRQLAEKYNVSHVTISKICDGINKKITGDLITRESKAIVEKVLLNPDLSIGDKLLTINEMGNRLTNYAAVHDVSHAILISGKRIAENKTVASHELKDVSVAAKNAGQMLGVSTCSSSPQIVNTNAVQVNANAPAIPIDEQEAARVYAEFIKQ